METQSLITDVQSSVQAGQEETASSRAAPRVSWDRGSFRCPDTALPH